MRIKIGMRTVKTAVCAALAILCAQTLHLLNPASAGIIALLSVTNSTRSSFETGFFRVCSLALATGVAWLSFTSFGYNAVAFGIYLLIFIPLAVTGKMSDGIPVSSVLVTHYLIAGNVSIGMVKNSFCLLFIGVGLALVANLYMPDRTRRLKKSQASVDDKMRQLLFGMSRYLADEGSGTACSPLLQNVISALAEAEAESRRHNENQLLSTDPYYLNYFGMRRLQVNVLTKMNELVEEIDTHEGEVAGVVALLESAGETFSEANDGLAITSQIETVLRAYREAALPETRKEFENRARLYQLLSEFERFIELKTEFYRNEQN